MKALLSYAKKQLTDSTFWSLLLVLTVFALILVINRPANSHQQALAAVERIRDVRGKILVVLVIRGGVQIGDDLLSLEQARREIPQMISSRGIRNFIVLATDNARWGDVVAVYGVAHIPNATSRQLSPRNLQHLAALPEVVTVPKGQQPFCGFSLSLDSIVTEALHLEDETP